MLSRVQASWQGRQGMSWKPGGRRGMKLKKTKQKNTVGDGEGVVNVKRQVFCKQWKIGTKVSLNLIGSGCLRPVTGPGCILRTCSLTFQSSGISLSVAPRSLAIVIPAILPPNMAEDASAKWSTDFSAINSRNTKIYSCPPTDFLCVTSGVDRDAILPSLLNKLVTRLKAGGDHNTVNFVVLLSARNALEVLVNLGNGDTFNLFASQFWKKKKKPSVITFSKEPLWCCYLIKWQQLTWSLPWASTMVCWVRTGVPRR